MRSAFRFLRKRLSRIVTVALNNNVALEGVTLNGICKFNSLTTFGSNVHINGVWVDGPGPVSIGHNSHFGKSVSIYTQNHNYYSTSSIPYDNTFIVKKVTIGNYVWVGSHVIILPGTTIEDGVIIQAGSVVHGLLERCGIYGGNPAKKFSSRDLSTFNKLNEYD